MKELLRKIHTIPANELIEINNTNPYAHKDCNKDPYLLADLFYDYIRDYLLCKSRNSHLEYYDMEGLERVIQKYQLV